MLENVEICKKKLKIVRNQILIYKDFVDENILNQNSLFDLQKLEFDLIAQIINFSNEINIRDNKKCN